MKKQNVRTLSFIVSTFTYLLFGAAIFDALESKKEEDHKVDLDSYKQQFKTNFSITEHDFQELEEIIFKYHPFHIYPQWYEPS
jgi:hypothetical protein